MAGLAAERAARRLAQQSAKLDVLTKEIDLELKRKPWRALSNPVVLMAVITGLATAQTGFLSYYQSQLQRSETVRKERLEEKNRRSREERLLIVQAIVEANGERSRALETIKQLYDYGIISSQSVSIKNIESDIKRADAGFNNQCEELGYRFPGQKSVYDDKPPE